MAQMAKPAFYAAVTTRLKRADVVVAEGVGGDREGDITLTPRRMSRCESGMRLERALSKALAGGGFAKGLTSAGRRVAVAPGRSIEADATQAARR